MLFKKINTSEKGWSTRKTEKESKESSESNEKGEGVEDKDLDLLFDDEVVEAGVDVDHEVVGGNVVVVAVVDDFVVEIVYIDCVARSLAWSWTSQWF